MTYQVLDKAARIILFSILCSYLVSNELRVSLIGDNFRKPIFLTSPEKNSDTLFVAEQHGLIKVIVNGKVVQTPLLDIQDRVHQPRMPGDERGLFKRL